jgi:8-oxo-dGTP diphosphatase
MAQLSEEEIRFCLRCGSPLAQAVRFGKLRPVCAACGWVYYADPKVAVTTLIELDGQVLLVRRNNDPARGLWTLPGGFVDAGEDPRLAAQRECLEETGLQVRVEGLVDVIGGLEHPRGAHILIAYRAVVLSGELAPGDDADQARFFSYQQLPPLAFKSTRKLLEPH